MALKFRAKFEVGKFDRTGNFRLWQRQAKDLLAQQGLLKALCKSKPNNMEALDLEELQEKATTTIRLCLADEVLYHVMKLMSPVEV